MSNYGKPRAKEAVERFVARVRHNIDVHLDTLAEDLVKALQEEGGQVSMERLSELARSASVTQAHESRVDVMAKLLGAMRLQDEATSIKGILDALGRGAAGEAARVAVMLLVDGHTLRAFGDHGYSGARPADVALDSFALLARAVRERQRVPVTGTTRGQDLPAFMQPAAGHAGVILPVVVAGVAVALVYAEGPDKQPAQPAGGGAVWIEHVEILVRHASSRLENITSRRTVEVLTNPA
jgi:hypothetical protein